MRRSGKVFFKDKPAGEVWQDEDGYGFSYYGHYLDSLQAMPISMTLPLRQAPYHSPTLFPFFDGLIPEGWLLEITVKNWKLNANDRMELLLTVCRDCIGAVHVERIQNEEVS